MAAGIKNRLSRYLGFFEKLVYILCEKCDFDLPFWFKPPFLTHLTKYAFDSCCRQKYKHILESRT
jgi:hypothetical protein